MLILVNMPDFEWDDGKNLINQHKHGLSFEQARDAFFDPFGIILPDNAHSIEEERLLLLAFAHGVLMVISFTKRNQRIRIISCREATMKERKVYV